MIVSRDQNWTGIGWKDLAAVLARLEAGADPESGAYFPERPLHAAAMYGSPEVVAELARRVSDVDAELDGHTALWAAVFANRPGNARALAAAGADPWRPMMNGWSPGRLSLATPTPDLFPSPEFRNGLSAEDVAAVATARHLITTLGQPLDDGFSLACVGGVTAAEVTRRLNAEPINEDELDLLEEDLESEDALAVVGVTDVPGGCVIYQPWAYGASFPLLVRLVSAGTVCYGMYANPKSGNQGVVARDGTIEDSDTHPGGGSPYAQDSTQEILATYLYQGYAAPYCFAGAGLRPDDNASISENVDGWLRLPERDWWAHR
ncbi:ankyrin repeat domain-containing protein [Nonomuraea sp. NPDC050310]|uniref:ankyrin repeat domain-containing protein n=1 Tax=Nonomuraea sp. NPDC050310 TaxID=3154935 RepID=UPI003404DDD2